GRRPDDAAGGAAPGMIPRSLDYLQLFGLLTARKASDAQRLLAPTDPLRASVRAAIEECLFAFARILFKKLTAKEHAPQLGEGGDTLPIDLLRKDKQFRKQLLPLSRASALSPF